MRKGQHQRVLKNMQIEKVFHLEKTVFDGAGGKKGQLMPLLLNTTLTQRYGKQRTWGL